MVGTRVYGGRVKSSGKTRKCGSAGKGEAINQPRIDAEAGGHMRQLDCRSGQDAKAGPVEHRIETCKYAKRGKEQHDAIDRIGVGPDLEATERRSDAGHRRADHDQRALRRNQAETPGRHDGIERTRIKVPDHYELDQRANEAGNDRTGEDCERKRQSGMGCGRGDIGAAHDELAMCKVDYTHHAEDDRKTAC